ncbi:hypothetical protein DMN91_011785 [Ooceraea biroi]|uniref:Reverse transcriptase zinc-binding domain-containing protein n=1 Tax=Ooceraea biroi TaxID=2015173 RepID=A0A3L8D6D2_OOCBI|nr:hypothetical protein DMN91_011785 [Ooceraea biroi]
MGDASTVYKYRSIFAKLSKLWSNQNQYTQIADKIKDICRVYLKTSVITRNSTFDCIAQLLTLLKDNSEKINICLDYCNLQRLTESEIQFLEEYYKVMEPLARALDILQSDTGMHFSYLLPVLTTLKEKLDKMILRIAIHYLLLFNKDLCAHVRRHGDVDNVEAADIYAEERVLTQRQWTLYLGGDTVVRVHTRDAVLPVLSEWMARSWGGINYHMTQILMGHGCFGTYLARIGKVPTDLCEHCGSGADSSEHTLLTCVAWSAERDELVAVLGPLTSLRDAVAGIVNTRRAWSAFYLFCVRVMRTKEERERAWQNVRPP